jgi:hypothetical protein
MATAVAQANPFFTPTQISGCQLWLDAADPRFFQLGGAAKTTLLAWNNKVPGGIATTMVSSPSLSGKYLNTYQTIRFNNNSLTATLSTAVGTGDYAMFAVWLTINGGTEAVLSIGPTGGPAAGIAYNGSYYNLYEWGQTESQYVAAKNQYVIQSGTRISSVKRVFYNGNAASPASGALNLTNTTLYIGNGTGFPINGEIAEVLMYQGTLTTGQRQEIEGYLAWKWGLQSSLPNTHPYKNSPIPPLLSPPISLPLGQINAFFLPTQVPGNQLWFDAGDSSSFLLSGTNITQWRDKSPNAYSVFQATAANQPALVNNMQNGLPGVQFTTASFLSNAGSNMPNFASGGSTSVFIAARNASANTGWNIINTIWFTAGAGAGATLRYHFSFNQATTAGTTLYTNGVITGQVTSNATPVNSNAILGFTASSSSQTIHTNGSVNTYSGVTLPNANDATLFILGENRNSVGVGSNIVVFEMLGYNTQVTNIQRQQIEGYLAWKWGMQGNLPVTHPYKNSLIPQLVNPPITNPIVVSGSWNPTRFPGCALWVDAKSPNSFTPSTGGILTAARDNSPTPKTITITNTVTYVPNTEIVFTNTTGIFTLAGMPSAPYDYIFVGTANTSRSTYRTMLRTASAPGTHSFLLEVNTDNAGMWNGSAFFQFGSLTQAPNEKAMFYGSMAGNRTITASKNGTIALTAPSPAGNESVLTCLGNSTGGGQPYGSLQEIVIYSQTLTTAQRQQVEGYLAWKWGLQGSLPPAHPWKNWPPPP